MKWSPYLEATDGRVSYVSIILIEQLANFINPDHFSYLAPNLSRHYNFSSYNSFDQTINILNVILIIPNTQLFIAQAPLYFLILLNPYWHILSSNAVTDLNSMNKRGDIFQQQFNRALFSTSGVGMLPSLTTVSNFHAEEKGKDKTSDSKHPPKIISFKYSEEHDSGRTSPSGGSSYLQ